MSVRFFMNAIFNASTQLWFWLAIIATAVGLELGALYFQEVLAYYPCELCIYVRVWLTSMALVSLLALFMRNFAGLRRTALVAVIFLTLGLAHETWLLQGLEYGWNADGACGLVANFPSWARLDEWWPTMFRVQDACSATPRVFGDFSMADGLTLVCIGLLVGCGLALFGDLKRR